MKKYVPTYEGTLRKHALTVPHCISKCSGIRVFGRRIKSLVFSTDVAIIKNINADAIIAVYPFTPQAGITQAIIGVSDVPVFVGVGGGLTNGQRSAHVAAFAEHQGAFGVVCNTFIDDDTIRALENLRWWDWEEEKIKRHIAAIQAGNMEALCADGERE